MAQTLSFWTNLSPLRGILWMDSDLTSASALTSQMNRQRKNLHLQRLTSIKWSMKPLLPLLVFPMEKIFTLMILFIRSPRMDQTICNCNTRLRLFVKKNWEKTPITQLKLTFIVIRASKANQYQQTSPWKKTQMDARFSSKHPIKPAALFSTLVLFLSSFKLTPSSQESYWLQLDSSQTSLGAHFSTSSSQSWLEQLSSVSYSSWALCSDLWMLSLRMMSLQYTI